MGEWSRKRRMFGGAAGLALALILSGCGGGGLFGDYPRVESETAADADFPRLADIPPDLGSPSNPPQPAVGAEMVDRLSVEAATLEARRDALAQSPIIDEDFARRVEELRARRVRY